MYDYYPYICEEIGSATDLVCPSGLKGNQVRILNSPAAVKLR